MTRKNWLVRFGPPAALAVVLLSWIGCICLQPQPTEQTAPLRARAAASLNTTTTTIAIDATGTSESRPLVFSFANDPLILAGDRLTSSAPNLSQTSPTPQGSGPLSFGTPSVNVPASTWTAQVSVSGGKPNTTVVACCRATTTQGNVLEAFVSVSLIGPGSSAAASPVPSNAQAVNTIYAGPVSGGPAAPSFRTLSGSDFGTQTANLFLAGPSSGGALSPTFRALATSDLPGVVPLTNVANTFASTQTLPVHDHGGQVYNVVAYGAVADAQNVYNAAMANNSPVLTSASNKFSAGDVGKLVMVQGAAAGNITLATTILSYQSPGQVTLATNATHATSNATVLWGTDNSATFQSVFNTAGTAPGGTVLIPRGNYMCGSSITIPYTSAVTYKGDGFLSHVNYWNSQGWMDLTQTTGTALYFTSANGFVLNSGGNNAILNQTFSDLAIIGPGSAGPSNGANGYGTVCPEVLGTNFCRWQRVLWANWNIGFDSDGNASPTTASTTDCAFHDVYAWGNNTGIQLKNCNNSNFYDADIQANTEGLRFNGGSNIAFHGGLVQANTGGIHINPQANASSLTVAGVEIGHKIWFEGNTSYSIWVDVSVASSSITSLDINGNHWSSNAGPINFSSLVNSDIVGFRFEKNDALPITLTVPANVDKWSVRDNRIAPGSSYSLNSGNFGHWENNTSDTAAGISTSYSNVLKVDVKNLAIQVNGIRLSTGTAAPTTGTWGTGDWVHNTAPQSGHPIGWGCSAGGTPGTWIAGPNYP